MDAAPQIFPRKRLLIVHNPMAGWRRQHLLRRVLDELARMGCETVIRCTAARGDAERIALNAAVEEWDGVVVAGGDGTINEVVNGLVAGAKEGRTLPLAVLPLGTANVLAAEIGLNGNAVAIADTIANGPLARVTLGTVAGRRFVMMAGIGFDADVVRSVDPAIKRLLGKFAYVMAVVLLLGRFRQRAFRVTVDGRQHEAGSIVLANGRHYAGQFICASSARLDDPSLVLCLFRADGPVAILRYALALALGRLDRLADVTMLKVREALINGVDGDMVQGDGDILGRLPARIAVAPEQLVLAVPASSALAARIFPSA